MTKWAIELGEHDISFQPRTAIKAQALEKKLVYKAKHSMMKMQCR